MMSRCVAETNKPAGVFYVSFLQPVLKGLVKLMLVGEVYFKARAYDGGEYAGIKSPLIQELLAFVLIVISEVGFKMRFT
jgi:hypothetical protein